MAFISEWFWFFLLLPIAAVSGWIIGRRGGERHSDTQVSRLSTTYFRGLNYLLNEQPDKAIELFLHIAELDKDTFETQVALGHLFRRRGEVDRAIRLHQALVQRPGLSDQQTRAGVASARRGLHALGPARSRRDRLQRPGRARHARAARPAPPDRHLPVRAGLGQGDRERPPIRGSDRRADGQAHRAVRVRARRPSSRGRRNRRCACGGRSVPTRPTPTPFARACSKAASMSTPATTPAPSVRSSALRACDPDYLPEILPAAAGVLRPRGRCARRARLPGRDDASTIAASRPVLALTRMVENEDGVPAARAYLARQLKDRPSVRGEAALIDLTLAEGADPAGDAARPQAHHRPVAGAQSELPLQPLRLRRAQPPLAMPELQGVGHDQAAAELRGGLIDAGMAVAFTSASACAGHLAGATLCASGGR